MNYVYSAQANAFYPTDLEDQYKASGTWPADGKEVAHSVFQEYALAPPPEGNVRGASEDGFPVWVAAPPMSDENVAIGNRAKREELMRQATAAVAPLQDAVDLDIATQDELEQLRAWKSYRVELNRLEDRDGYPLLVDWPVQPT